MSVRKWDVQATGSGRRSNVQILVDLNTPHLSDVDGSPRGICPRMFMRGKLSHWGLILGVMVSECMFIGMVHLKKV